MRIAALTIQAAQSAPVTHIAQRSILVAVVFFAIGMAFFGMRSAWQKKSRRFADIPEPSRFAPVEATTIVAPVEGRFAGTTTAGNWLDRVTVHDLGLPQSISVTVTETGLQLLGVNNFALWIPGELIHGVRTARGLAGDVVEPDGMIIVTWRLGYQDLDSGIRVSRHADHERVLDALNALTSLNALPSQAHNGKTHTLTTHSTERPQA